MHNYQIEDMVDAVVDSFIDKNKLRQTVRQALKKCWEGKIAITWNVDDVKQIAKDNGRRITDEDAKDVLAAVLDNHDAAIGVNWDVLFFNLFDLPEKKK